MLYINYIQIILYLILYMRVNSVSKTLLPLKNLKCRVRSLQGQLHKATEEPAVNVSKVLWQRESEKVRTKVAFIRHCCSGKAWKQSLYINYSSIKLVGNKGASLDWELQERQSLGQSELFPVSTQTSVA